jgi:hypothetical protein
MSRRKLEVRTWCQVVWSGGCRMIVHSSYNFSVWELSDALMTMALVMLL